MRPDIDKITITDNLVLIQKLLNELVLQPRIVAQRWSAITKQTPSLKIGYPGQHLASLVLGIEGKRTGARGHDILDGSEVKSCSRVDATDACKDCKGKVLRQENKCGHCGSENIKRDNTSKWLFTIRNERDLETLTLEVPRVVLLLADYPDMSDYNRMRFQVFEIWPRESRCSAFVTLMTNYYTNIYQVHKAKDPEKTPAPKNFWPYSYQFYKCNPIRTFCCFIENVNTDPRIVIDHYVEPDIDRGQIASELMPSTLAIEELRHAFDSIPREIVENNLSSGTTYETALACLQNKRVDKRALERVIPFLDERIRSYLPLRDDTTFTIDAYTRR